MADFAAVLKKTIDALPDNGPAMREKVYDKARATVTAKLAAISPPPAASVADRQKQALEDAIRDVEAGYASPEPDPFAELENVLAASAAKRQPDMPVGVAAAEVAPARLTFANDPVLAGSDADPEEWPALGPKVEDPAAERPSVSFDEEIPDQEEEAVLEEPARRRRNFAPLIAAVVVLALIAGGAYAVWLNKADFLAMKDDLLAKIGVGGETVATAPADTSTKTQAPETAQKPAAEPAPAADAAATPESAPPADAQGVQKFTQRLNDDGTETDEGPAGGIASIGEGTSVAAVTQPPTPVAPETTPPAGDATATPPAADGAAPAAPATADPAAPATADAAPPAAADPAAPATDPATAVAAATAPTAQPSESDSQVAVGQKAIFYEERTNVAEGSAEPGNVVWSLVQESPGNDQPPEPAIRGEATIPGKDIQLRMTIRRNADKTLPASHIIELIFLTPDNFEGGGIENILRFALKDTEAAAGNPVLGIPAKIADGFFLVALNDTKAEIETNLSLLKRQRWIDVPLVYKSGRRALITLEKGLPGEKVFDEAIKAWETKTASQG